MAAAENPKYQAILTYQEQAGRGRFLLGEMGLSLRQALFLDREAVLAALSAGNQPGEFPFPPTQEEQERFEASIAAQQL